MSATKIDIGSQVPANAEEEGIQLNVKAGSISILNCEQAKVALNCSAGCKAQLKRPRALNKKTVFANGDFEWERVINS